MDDNNVNISEEVEQQEQQEQRQSRFIVTANHGFAPFAQEELRRLFGSVKSTVLISGEVFLVSVAYTWNEVAGMIANQAPIFVRHIQPVDIEIGADQLDVGVSELKAYLLRQEELQGASVSLQVRKSEQSLSEKSAGALREQLLAEMEELHAEFTVQDAKWILSVFVSSDHIYAGVSRPQDNLSDWNGGAVRFQREEGQISRAKFKLLEAEKSFGIDFSAFRHALDIGAAPGGWTSFLLERGIHVTAVDPAKMHESLVNNSQLKIMRKNASEVKFRDNQFDLLVCDMSWSPKQMVKLVKDLLYCLSPGGTAIVTVKLMHKKPMALIKEVIASFEEDQMQLQYAKQLFHNRDEITLHMIKY
ncbi:SAM-dependent methyltransferase [Paenibacillus macquariensis subsp. defensor]|nr:SAM-dependent methyltransferase [Paenibacillus macquariensis subsp. defensor]